MMTGSNSSRIAGSANTTVTMLIRAPRAINMQREEITEIPDMGDQNRLLFALSASSLNLIPASHQDRVVNGGSQLDRSDDDRSDERKRSTCIVRKSHVDEDRALDDQDQQDRKAQRRENEHDDRRNDTNGSP